MGRGVCWFCTGGVYVLDLILIVQIAFLVVRRVRYRSLSTLISSFLKLFFD